MLDYKTQWRRSFGIQYFVATWMKQDTSAYASRGWRFMCQSTDVEKYSNHSKNQGEKVTDIGLSEIPAWSPTDNLGYLKLK